MRVSQVFYDSFDRSQGGIELVFLRCKFRKNSFNLKHRKPILLSLHLQSPETLPAQEASVSPPASSSRPGVAYPRAWADALPARTASPFAGGRICVNRGTDPAEG